MVFFQGPDAASSSQTISLQILFAKFFPRGTLIEKLLTHGYERPLDLQGQKLHPSHHTVNLSNKTEHSRNRS